MWVMYIYFLIFDDGEENKGPTQTARSEPGGVVFYGGEELLLRFARDALQGTRRRVDSWSGAAETP